MCRRNIERQRAKNVKKLFWSWHNGIFPLLNICQNSIIDMYYFDNKIQNT